MAEQGLIIDVDYNITKAEAKANKLNREFDISKQKAENIKKEIQALNDELERSKVKEQEYTIEAERLRDRLNKYAKNELDLTDTQVKKESQRYNELVKLIEKEQAHQRSKEKSLATQELSLKKQNAETANIGDQILANGKKQSKFSQAFDKSTKSADRFGKRLKSLIASALFFSLVTKAFTALRNEFGKLITETGTKTASLVAQLNGSLAVLGRTIYESAKPYIEWILQKLIQVVNVITYVIAKMLGKSVDEMKKLVDKSKELSKETKKTEGSLASFDELNILSKSESEDNTTNSQQKIDVDVDDKELDDLQKKLDTILLTVGLIALAFGTWKITSFLSSLGIIPSTIATILSGILLCALGAAGLTKAAIDWDDSLHNGENTLNAILGTVGTILLTIGLITLGITAWPVLIIGALVIAGMWIDNFKDKIDEWLNSLPAGIYDIMSLLITAAYGIWDFIKNLFKGLYEICTGDWEKGLKRIGISLLNLLVDAVNIISDAINFVLWPIRELIVGAGKIAGKDWKIKDIAIPHISRFPQLATGAVLPGGSPMLAWVNDQPKGQTYVEGSVENIAAAFEKYLSGKNIGGNAQDNRPIILQVDSREVARANRQGESKLGSQTVFGGFANVY